MESRSRGTIKNPEEPTDAPVEEDRRSLLKAIQSMELMKLTASTDSVAAQNLPLLRRRLNELAPFYRLPTEIIFMVFLSLGNQNLKRPLPNHLAISSVSYLWRKIALQIPQLWACIFSVYPASFLDVCLARCGRTPLIVRSDVAAAHKNFALSRFIKQVSSQMWRWHTCVLHNMGVKAVGSFMLDSAPMLEVLSLTAQDYRFEEYTVAICTPNIHTPRLRILKLHGIFIPLTNPIYLNLRELRLGFIIFVRPDTVRKMLRVLEACPLLEVLHLDSVHFTFLSDEAEGFGLPETAVMLSCLRRVRVKQGSPQWAVRSILSHIMAARHCCLEIIVGSASLKVLTDVVPSWLDAKGKFPGLSLISHLDIRLLGGGELSIKGIGSGADVFKFDTTTFLDYPQILPVLGRIFPMPLLERLTVINCRDHAEAFAEFLDRHRTIQAISLSGAEPKMMEIFRVTPTRHLCPSLRELVIEQCNVSAAHLVDVLKSRIRPGPTSVFPEDSTTSLRHLKIIRCLHITRAAVAELEEHLVVECA